MSDTLTTIEAADLSGLTSQGFTKAARRGGLTAVGKGANGISLYARRDVERFLATRRKRKRDTSQPKLDVPTGFFGEGGGGERAVVYAAHRDGTLGSHSPWRHTAELPPEYLAAWRVLHDTDAADDDEQAYAAAVAA